MGNISAATSTGGMTTKCQGGGDSQLLDRERGHKVCGVSSTGHGEYLLSIRLLEVCTHGVPKSGLRSLLAL